MHCFSCTDNPSLADKQSPLFTGSRNMRVDPLKKHETSASHIKATETSRRKTMSQTERKELVRNGPLVKASKRSAQINMNTLKVMFNSVYALAKKGKPLSDYETHMEIHMKNRQDIGKDYIDIGSNYLTEKSAKLFLLSIAEEQRHNTMQRLTNVRFVTVLADGSTDYSIVEQYNVLIRFVFKGVAVT